MFLPDAVLAGPGAHLDPAAARLALRVAPDDVAIVGASERVNLLLAAESDAVARARYVETYGVCGTRRFQAGDAVIYGMSVETFPRHVNNIYLVVEGGASLLFDCGSALPSTERDLALGFAVTKSVYGCATLWEDVDACLISHAHGDHWGGANRIRQTSRASLAVHELDAPVVESFEERLAVMASEMDGYWRRAGFSPEECTRLRQLYETNKGYSQSAKIDRVVRDGDVVGAGYKVHHVPGHCPGLVCLQVQDVLLTSDHVLERITPHQFPQELTAFSGLDHYFRSLEKVTRLDGIRLALGGHEDPILDYRKRAAEIAAFHHARLERTMEICSRPRSVAEVMREMFGEQEGYGSILAIGEAGAHVEYLHAIGRLRAEKGEGDAIRYSS